MKAKSETAGKVLPRYDRGQLKWLSKALCTKQDAENANRLFERANDCVEDIFKAAVEALQKDKSRGHFCKVKREFKPAVKSLRKNGLLNGEPDAFFRDVFGL
jgi:hypothetical protein